jgi:hypothetical protein
MVLVFSPKFLFSSEKLIFWPKDKNLMKTVKIERFPRFSAKILSSEFHRSEKMKTRIVSFHFRAKLYK